MKKHCLMLTFLVQVSVVFSQTHFVKGYSKPDALTPNNLKIINADIGGVPLELGDEIAVFDENLCCGVVTLTGQITTDPATFVDLYASAEEIDLGVSQLNGFRTGNKVYLRFWDKSAGIEYFNVVPTFIDQTTGNPTTAKPFAIGETYFISASKATTTKTWDGNSSTLWSDPDAWSPIGVPEPTDDVILPNGTAIPYIPVNYKASCGNLTFDNSNLDIYSTASGPGSLIVASKITGSNTVKAKKYMTKDVWHLVSSPVSGQTISGFLNGTATTIIPANSGNRGMMDFNETGDNWNDFFTNSSLESIQNGNGYSMRVTHTSAAGNTVSFIGSLSNTNILAPVTKNKFGWNLLGNPFTSAMYVRQEVFGFLVQNDAMLHSSFKAMYLWDPAANAGSGGYTVVNLTEGQANLAYGQGFFIKAAAAGNVVFNKQMQVHQTDAPFKSASVKWPSLVLNAKSTELSASTKILFNEKMTAGLDPGYDAGILKSGNGFDIYSRLVTDNGVDFMVQALPGSFSDKYVIPIGIDATKGGEVVFSAQALNLPAGYEVFLEDKLSKTVKSLNGSDQYIAAISSDIKGTGRFYLHVGSSVQTSVPLVENEKINVYTSDNLLYINGKTPANEKIAIYSIDGKLKDQQLTQSVQLQNIDISGYSPGIYILRIGNGRNIATSKFVKR